jgi:predicted metal-dependent phosphoesterase TrpH
MRLDLHVHTTASDGSSSPAEVVRLAIDGGLDVLAITDHDTVAGIAAAQEAAAETSLQLIPGIEMSSTQDGAEYHILGYFVDPEADAIQAHGRHAVEGRGNRMDQMVDRLRGQGLLIEMSDVLDAAGPDRSAIARPHLARALVAKGYAKSVVDAFDRLIGDGHPAYVPTGLATPEEAIGLILEAGGTPVWAHPPMHALTRLLPTFIGAGLEGLEVYRPRSTPGHIRKLEQAAKAASILMTGGSDWHDGERGHALGTFVVTEEEVGELLEAGGMSGRSSEREK